MWLNRGKSFLAWAVGLSHHFYNGHRTPSSAWLPAITQILSLPHVLHPRPGLKYKQFDERRDKTVRSITEVPCYHLSTMSLPWMGGSSRDPTFPESSPQSSELSVDQTFSEETLCFVFIFPLSSLPSSFYLSCEHTLSAVEDWIMAPEMSTP